MSESVNTKCRICLHSENELDMNNCFNIYLDKLSLASIFTNITSLLIEDNEYFPKKICQSCTASIINFNTLLKNYHESSIWLTKHLCKEEDDNNISDSDFENFQVCKREDDSDKSDVDSKNIEKKIYELNCTKIEPSIEVPQPITRKHEPVSSDYNVINSFKYTCHCGDCFLHKGGFRQHMQSRHNVVLDETDAEGYSKEIQVKIPIGFPEFVESKVLVRKKKMQCRICDTVFLTEDEVKSHEIVHKTYICDQCGAAFLYKKYLVDHLRIHSEERRYTCRICQKKFKHRYTYGVHKRSHDITRDFVCETCGVSFKSKPTLNTHILLKHTNMRNYPCPDCNLCFNLKSTLDKHFIRKHTADRKKSFVCSKCGAAYLNKNTLTRHVAEKHLGKAKLFPCTICENKTYVAKKGLKSHMLKKHGISYD